VWKKHEEGENRGKGKENKGTKKMKRRMRRDNAGVRMVDGKMKNVGSE
jgi:hypothetical protein